MRSCPHLRGIMTGQVCQAFLPILRKQGRIVNVSSQSSLLKYMILPLRGRFRDPNKTLQDVEMLLQEYEVRC